MRDFFKSLFASLVALVLFSGGGFLLFLLVMVALSPAEPTVPSKAVLVFDLGTPITDGEPDPSPSEVLTGALQGGGTSSLTLRTVVDTLDRAAKDSKVSALYLTGNVGASGYASGLPALKEVREAITRFKASGKPVLAHNQSWGKRDLYLASAATRLSVAPLGMVDTTGLGTEPMFYAGALKKLGVEVQVTRVGKYKSAVEPFILEKMSDANREQTQKLLDDVWSEWKQVVAADRHQRPEDLQALADTKGPLNPAEAVAAKLVDRVATVDEVLEELKKLAGKQATDREFPQMELGEYARIPGGQNRGKHRIAVVTAEGEIVDGHGEGAQVGGDRLAEELRRLRMDKDIKAVVLRVNSPGGSALASEVIQRETRLLKQAGKPFVVSMGTVAASGGYWISAYADRIFAQPTTITGSIGVFGMLPNAQKLLGTLGVGVDRVQTSKLANLESISRPKSTEELARIQSVVDEIYEQFLTKVSEGRKLPKDTVQEIAQGRVWSGREALKLGLVDELGGLQEAVRHAAKLAKVESDFRIDGGGPEKSPVEKMLKAFSGDHKKRLVKAGPAMQLQTDLMRQLESLKALNDPRGVYARMPMELSFR